RDIRILGIAAIQMRHMLASESKQGWPVMLDGNRPCLGGLGRVRGTNDIQSRNGPQTREMLNGLVRWTILAHANAVVRKDIERLQLAQRAEPDGRLHVIG